jgi:hypothetical protein
MEWTKEELSKLRENLPTGWADILAERLKMKSGSIKNIMSGRPKNETVVIAAAELALEHREAVNALKQQITSL